MSIVAHSDPFVVGVDTHARNHVYAILAENTGALLETRALPTTAAGINRAITWIARRTEAAADTLWVIEGAASHGPTLAGTVSARRKRLDRHRRVHHPPPSAVRNRPPQPANVHYGHAAGVARERSATLAAARAKHPERFTTTTDPKILALPGPAWINQPKEIPEQSAA